MTNIAPFLAGQLKLITSVMHLSVKSCDMKRNGFKKWCRQLCSIPVQHWPCHPIAAVLNLWSADHQQPSAWWSASKGNIYLVLRYKYANRTVLSIFQFFFIAITGKQHDSITTAVYSISIRSA